MYDFVVSLLEAIFKHGWSLSSAGAIVFLLLKQRKIKKRLKRFFPWMFSEDNDVRAYATNQLIILENQRRIMITLGVEPCADGLLMKSNEPDRRSLNMLSNLLRPATVRANQLQEGNQMKLVVIDAGHGGKDPGAIGTTKTREKDFALSLALKLEKRLSGSSITPVLTRKGDTYLELDYRSHIANNMKVDAFISIHANSTATMGSASGTETLYTRDDCLDFANTLHKHLIKATGLNDRKVKKQNLAVTRDTKMPAALLEVGFINHPADEIKLFDPSFQDKVAESIAQALFEFFGAMDRPDPKDVPYPEMEVTVYAHENQPYTGYNIKDRTWIPARPVADLLGASIGYKGGKVVLNGVAVETININGTGFIQANEFKTHVGAKVFWDKAKPNKVDIYKGA